MRILFLMDPASIMLPDKDTSFAFMREAQLRGHTCFHCLPADLESAGRELFARVRPLKVLAETPFVELAEEQRLDVATFGAVLIRKDPPFDPAYLHMTQQLDLVKDRTLVLNDPRGLRDANEKLFALHFAEYMPRSLVSARPAAILDFVAEVGGSAVLKPLDGAGGAGVVILRRDDRNARALVDLLTREGREPALVQAFLPQVTGGDKRVLLLDGEPLGAIRRIPRDDEFRANIHVGGRVEATDLTPAEQRLVCAVAPKLREHGLWFVGLDLIDEHLIEINVTSPTGIQELGRLTSSTPETRVIEWLEEQQRSGA